MSRNHKNLSQLAIVTRGSDHVLGRFVQVSDVRYALSGDDMQGEGYVLDWDEGFGFTTNLIGAKVEDLGDDNKLLELVNVFCKENDYNH